MKLKFNARVQDKYTKAIYEKDSVYEFEDERAMEILATGYADIVEEAKEIDNLDEALENGEMVDLNQLTLKELKKLAKEEGVSTSGSKSNIIERIMSKHED
jgi:hypothetical protein